jgi:hypothetical protein
MFAAPALDVAAAARTAAGARSRRVTGATSARCTPIEAAVCADIRAMVGERAAGVTGSSPLPGSAPNSLRERRF